MRRHAQALLLFPLLVGCGDLPPHIPERGDCTLDHVTQRVIHSRPLAPDEMIELAAPFAVTLKPNDLDGTPEVMLVLEGDGWHHPNDGEGGGRPTVRIIKPDGTLTQTLSFKRGDAVIVEHTVNAPGVWTYVVERELIGCRQVVAIQVIPEP